MSGATEVLGSEALSREQDEMASTFQADMRGLLRESVDPRLLVLQATMCWFHLCGVGLAEMPLKQAYRLGKTFLGEYH